MKPKICVICSGGGHFTEAMELAPAFEKHPHFFVTFKVKGKKIKRTEKKTYYIFNPGKKIPMFLLTFLESLYIFIKEKPEVVITTGAGLAIPFCYIAKFFGKKIIFLETMTAITKPSNTGKIIYPIADLFIIQWESLREFFPKATYGGPLV
jgi:beta-1,4-N-acetylglucosaminyltransferase